MVVKKGKKKKSAARSPMAGLMAKQRRQNSWRESIIFLFKNTSICTENYVNFEANHWAAFKNSLTGHETSLKDIALVSNRIKFEELPPKPVPSTLKEFKAQKPKKLTKKARIREAKNPSLKPLPKVTLETAFQPENQQTIFTLNQKTEAIDRYLDIIDRLKTLSKIALDFNKSIDKFPEDLRGAGLTGGGLEDQEGAQYAMLQASTVSDLENDGAKMVAYWHGLSGAKTFKVAECGSVGFSMPALLDHEQENEILKNKWAHLAKTILRLAQNFVTYASRKTGIVINDNPISMHAMRLGLTDEQIEVMDKLTKSILVTPVTAKSVERTQNLLGGLDLSSIGKTGPSKEELARITEEEEIANLPGRSDQNTLHLPDEPPKVGLAKKKKKGTKKYSIQK